MAKAERLEQDTKIAQLHDAATQSSSNATRRGNRDDQILTHFVALVHVDGQLYELDGRKPAPICHGPTTQSTLLQDACKVVQQTMIQCDPSETRFAITALAPKLS
jgi:ubiquitin carboxyl-terminal hydrolase L3